MNSNHLCAFLISTLFFFFKLIENGAEYNLLLFLSFAAIPFWISLIAVIIIAINIISSKSNKNL